MSALDLSKEWVIVYPPVLTASGKCVLDLSRCLGLLAGSGGKQGRNPPAIVDSAVFSGAEAEIILNYDNSGPERNGFMWRAETTKVEIFGESYRGLCNGIYSFLATLGIRWPAPGQEQLPSVLAGDSLVFPLSNSSINEPSGNIDGSGAAAPRQRLIFPCQKSNKVPKKSDVFAAWAARQRRDAVILPLSAFTAGNRNKIKRLRDHLAEYDIALEAGGRELSSLIPRSYYLFYKDIFRMDDGKRKKEHHFCPTNPEAIKLIKKTGAVLFRKAGTNGGNIDVFHLWPEKEAESLWCSCPSCRAFTHPEQNRIVVNAASDALSDVFPGAYITFYEKPGEVCNVPLRKSLIRMETLP